MNRSTNNKMTVRVTRADIKDAKACNAACCPIAKAFNRTNKQKGWLVAGAHAYGKGKTLFLPALAVKFQHDFDLGRPVKPFTFTATVYPTAEAKS